MCKKNIGKRRVRNINLPSSQKRYSGAIAAALIGERPIPVLTGKSAVCFFMKASKVEEEMGKSGALIKPSELKAFKNYAESVAAMEAESHKMEFK